MLACAVLADIVIQAPFDPKGGHIQGLCGGNGHYYLSQMTRLFKVDREGKCVKSVPVLSHTGDLCFHDGFLYASVAVYDGPRKGQGAIQVYDENLTLVREKFYPRGMDGIACLNGKLYVGNGSHLETVPCQPGNQPQSKTPHLENDLSIVDPATLELEKTVVYSHGDKTRYGAQNIDTDGKLLYVSFYGATARDPDLVAYDANLKPVAKYVAQASNGLIYTKLTEGLPSFLKCVTTRKDGLFGAVLTHTVAQEKKGR